MKRFSILRFYMLMAFLVFFVLPGLTQSPSINSDNGANLATTVGPRSLDMNEGRAAQPVNVATLDIVTNNLPDAPSAARESDWSSSTAAVSDQGITEPVLATSAKNEPVANWPYWASTGAVFGSNIAAIEVLQSCLGANKCQSIPSGMRSRGAMYGVGMPVAAGVSYLDYYLKKKEKRWWYVPAIAATAFDMVFVVRGAVR